MSTQSIPLMVSTTFNSQDIQTQNLNSFYQYFVPGEKYWANQPNDKTMQFWMLDRTDPSSPPVFNAAAPDSSTIPDGITPYLTTDYIMIATVGAWMTEMPQGDLYNLLRSNGGGLELTKMELLANPFKCGVNSGLVYSLISIPGSSEHSGLEFLAIQGQGYGSQNTYQTLPFIKMCHLIPIEEAGKTLYTPVELGGD